MNRVQALECKIRACTACRETCAATATGHAPRPVIRLSATARICICGPAPGIRIHASGLPFDDPSGDRLRSWMGIVRETLYDRHHIAFSPMAFCFPGRDTRDSDLPSRRSALNSGANRCFPRCRVFRFSSSLVPGPSVGISAMAPDVPSRRYAMPKCCGHRGSP